MYLKLAPNASLWADLFSNAESSEPMYQRPKAMDVAVFYLSVTYFQFQFPPSVCFYWLPD